MTPLSVVGGYLGAGKTTFINRLLAGDHGLRLAVLVNDFGEVNIDASLIASHEGDTYTLTNGCICCSIGDDLSGTLIDIARSANPPDEVVIEASGVADATRFATYSGEWIGFGLRGVVVLADAETIRAKATDKYVGDLVEQQLIGADLIILNKVDLISADAATETKAWIESLGAEAPIISTTNAEVPLDVLFDRPVDGSVRQPTDPTDVDHEAMYASTVVRDDAASTKAGLEAALDGLPRSVVRAKGMVVLAGGEVVLVQMVGKRWTITDAPGAEQQTKLVLISMGYQADLAKTAGEFRRQLEG